MNVQRALVAQLIAKLSPSRVTIVDASAKPWASVTFSGERHEITLLVEGENALGLATRLQRTVGCDEFHISGHLVADIVVSNLNADSHGVRLNVEALTVKED